MLNKQKGNMYAFVTHTWNPIKGKCRHDCKYCYMKVYKQKPLRLVEKELNDDLGQDNFIFVGSSTDMFALDVSKCWIDKIFSVCKKYPKNRYLFQSKKTSSMFLSSKDFPSNSVLGTTIETNRAYAQMGKAPLPEVRSGFMSYLSDEGFKTMVTIEPIMDFDLKELVELVKACQPEWVNVGADSKGHNLPEPSKENILKLIEELRGFTDVKIKDNLKRITDKVD